MKFKMKKKPEKPERIMDFNYEISVCNFKNFQELKNHIDSICQQYTDSKLVYSKFDIYSDYDYTYISFNAPESLDNYQKRMNVYKNQLKNYYDWYDANEENIKIELQKQKDKKLKLVKNKKKRLLDQLKQIQSQENELNNIN
jgi:hypothetical protein